MPIQNARTRRLIFALTVLLCLAVTWALADEPASTPKPTTQDCMGCHDGMAAEAGPEEKAEMLEPNPPEWKVEGPKAGAKRAGVSLTIDLKKMKDAVHGTDCLGCHADITKLNHNAKLQPVKCGNCHDDYVEAYFSSAHWRAAKEGNVNSPVCADCHGAHYMVSPSEEGSSVYRENVAKTCGQCHATDKLPGHQRAGALEEWNGSIHAQRKDGKRVNATCNDCHSSHEVGPFRGSVAKANISRTCGKCHEKSRKDFEAGAHGAALAAGNLSSPTCTDCHGAHLVKAVSDPDSQVYGYKAVRGVCGQCHQAERINSRFALNTNVNKTYEDSFHGLALKKGDLRSADCASCHESHLILSSSDPKSSIHPDNLQTTCGKCHPSIGKGAAVGKMHSVLDRNADTIGEKVQWWVRYAYLFLIPGTLGFMFFHNLIDWLKKVRKHLSRMRAMGVHQRLTPNERYQHIVLMISFSLLAISGFALTFGWKIPGLSGETNETLRAYVHRIAALGMVGWALFHFYWVLATKRGRGYVLGMIPKLKDAYDMVYTMAYNVGLWKKKPKFERFSYIEKMEYLAMIWGTAVMVITGFMLWFEEPMLRFLPLWALDVAHLVHYMEAILATLAIIIWHFYSVLLNPDVAPMATHWLTGTLTEEEMEHEHAAEWERIKREKRLAAQKESGQGEEDVQ
ncbi:MAG: cytochrome c3 family protein [Candidatus Lernaella stagnicola]|nr:cytochrome c3 family protein [Candidatus Lernaella stagnicola]